MTNNSNNAAQEDSVWDELLKEGGEEEISKTKKVDFQKSSLLLSASYNKLMKSLTLVFKGGQKYCYFDVPKKTVEHLFSLVDGSSSAGRFFITEIKYKFPHHKLS